MPSDSERSPGNRATHAPRRSTNRNAVPSPERPCDTESPVTGPRCGPQTGQGRRHLIPKGASLRLGTLGLQAGTALRFDEPHRVDRPDRSFQAQRACVMQPRSAERQRVLSGDLGFVPRSPPPAFRHANCGVTSRHLRVVGGASGNCRMSALPRGQTDVCRYESNESHRVEEVVRLPREWPS